MGPSGQEVYLNESLGCLDTPRLEHIFLMARMSVKKDDELAEIRNKEICFFQTLIYAPYYGTC
jgi:hypothetical protein